MLVVWCLATVQLCYGETLNRSCPSGSVLMVDAAVYGRMRPGVCGTSDVHIGCSADVTSRVEASCAGRRRCPVTITNDMRTLACPSDQLGYLQLTHHCLPGIFFFFCLSFVLCLHKPCLFCVYCTTL